ncbi:MAG: hypothetical protein V4719_25540 [Planctomycetota bacterium]
MVSELSQLREQIGGQARSPARVGLLEQAIQITDSQHDVTMGYELRLQLVQYCIHLGFPEKVLLAYSWLLAQTDRDPNQFPETRRLLWQYKWAVHTLLQFPQISLQQLDAARDDLAVRFERNGASPRSVHKLHCILARHLGDRERLEATLPLWKKSPRDHLTDCVACDRASLVSTHAFLGQYRRALQLAQPILNGKLSCASQPHLTYANVLVPSLRLGRIIEAAEYHQRGYLLVKDDPSHISAFGGHLIYLVLVQNLPAGIKLFERHLRAALATSALLNRYNFYRASLFLMLALQKSGTKLRKLRLPETFPLWNEGRQYDLAELTAWFEHEARELARQFDVRNGNHFRMTELDDLATLEASVGLGS